MANKDELDQILDRALSGYVETEPLAGLEQRILQRVQNRSRFRQPLYLGLGLASAVLVLVAIMLLPVGQQHQQTSLLVRKDVAQTIPPLKPDPAAVHPAPLRPHPFRARARVRPVPRSLPKQEQFPAASPLTAEEQRLVAFVREHPQEAINIFNDPSHQTNEPIKIKPIEIQPLQIQAAL